ncbi:hypothetical protein Ahy_A10g049871 [Arachis hypogaea]|uniref:MULE transposase domain-containing protein n=1 Tax=Arachis hypogaea TaxID=3818 RepID=A0A445B824_ARAHY|nr:hypothetical protein Ahy_A10g049871 [Arachis hypogaea]
MTFKTLEEAEKFYKDYFKLAEILKKYRELSMFVRHTIENNKEARIIPSKTYQSFVAASRGHHELNVRNYITREVWNISKQDDAKEFVDARSRTAYQYFGDIISFDTTYNTNRYNLVFGSFMSVNHHGQSTLLGCALMKNENIHHSNDLYANNNSLVVHLAYHEEDLKQIKWLQVTRRNRTRDESCCLELNDFLTKYGVGGNKCFQITAISFDLIDFLYEDRHFGVSLTESEELTEKFCTGLLIMSWLRYATLNDVNDLQSPPNVRTRGRPKNRLGSNMEKIDRKCNKKKASSKRDENLQKGLKKAADGFGILMTSYVSMTLSVNLFTLSKRMVGPYFLLMKASTS